MLIKYILDSNRNRNKNKNKNKILIMNIIVLVSITYKNSLPTKQHLHGTANDTLRMKSFLEGVYGDHGKSSYYHILSDDYDLQINNKKNYIGLPTKRNMRRLFQELIPSYKNIKDFVICISSHGKTVSQSGYERDASMEKLVLLTDDGRGVVHLDDLEYTLYLQNLKSVERIISINDLCHSGGVVNLPYLYEGDKKNGGHIVDSGQHVIATNSTKPTPIISICASYEEQYAMEVNNSGIFTTVLLKTLGRLSEEFGSYYTWAEVLVGVHDMFRQWGIINIQYPVILSSNVGHICDTCWLLNTSTLKI